MLITKVLFINYVIQLTFIKVIAARSGDGDDF